MFWILVTYSDVLVSNVSDGVPTINSGELTNVLCVVVILIIRELNYLGFRMANTFRLTVSIALLWS